MTSLLGQTVEWTSHGGGKVSTKRGSVIADVEPGQRHGRAQLPLECRQAFGDRLRFNWLEGWRDGVIVRVDRPGKLPLYYAPRRKGLKVVTP